jgi:hypothetical protein
MIAPPTIRSCFERRKCRLKASLRRHRTRAETSGPRWGSPRTRSSTVTATKFRPKLALPAGSVVRHGLCRRAWPRAEGDGGAGRGSLVSPRRRALSGNFLRRDVMTRRHQCGGALPRLCPDRLRRHRRQNRSSRGSTRKLSVAPAAVPVPSPSRV